MATCSHHISHRYRSIEIGFVMLPDQTPPFDCYFANILQSHIKTCHAPLPPAVLIILCKISNIRHYAT
jgi:hypothetical protein